MGYVKAKKGIILLIKLILRPKLFHTSNPQGRSKQRKSRNPIEYQGQSSS